MSYFTVAALYKFVSLPDYQEVRENLWEICQAQNIKGTLLLAEEGINGTVAGTREAIDALNLFFKADERFHNLEYKESTAQKMPFFRLKVRLKKEIVTLGVEGVNPNQKVGTYVNAEEWNTLLEDPEMIVIDTRNDYEYEIGTFKKALNPHTNTFREFPEFVKKNLDPKKHKKIAMCCTGGIRCEKASSYMLSQGFEEVYHLKGGILKYLEEMPVQKSLWEGECFVFDHRTAIVHGLEEGASETCYSCRKPIAPEDKLSSQYEEGISCPKCYDTLTPKARNRYQERHRQILMAKAKGIKHIGR
jgi:UPF0176 protein